jgi:hypothetical protein
MWPGRPCPKSCPDSAERDGTPRNPAVRRISPFDVRVPVFRPNKLLPTVLVEGSIPGAFEASHSVTGMRGIRIMADIRIHCEPSEGCRPDSAARTGRARRARSERRGRGAMAWWSRGDCRCRAARRWLHWWRGIRGRRGSGRDRSLPGRSAAARGRPLRWRLGRAVARQGCVRPSGGGRRTVQR